MFRRIQLESSEHVFAFVAFLLANPQLKHLVYTIVVTPAAFGPSLLYILPNLSSIECVDESQLEEPEDEGEDEEDEMSNIPDLSRLDLFPYRWQSDWFRLKHLVLQFSGEASVHRVAEFMERFPNTPRLSEVLIEWRRWAQRIVQDISCSGYDSGPDIYQAYKKLEHALLRFPRTRLKFLVDGAGQVDTKTLSFWACELEKHLPALLAQGGLVECQCKEGGRLVRPSPLQHYDGVQALVISPDSKWLATGSRDSTIILWDTANPGAIVQRWVPHSYYGAVTLLVFSPDSQYLLSADGNGKVAIWDVLGQGARKVTTLEGHVATIAWSPDGETIVTGSEDGTVRLWDAHTFRERAFFQLKGAVACLAFSSNGTWLAYASDRGECCVINVTVDALHGPRSLWNSPPDHSHWLAPVRDRIIAFDPSCGSTRLAIAPCGSPVVLSAVDVETGSVLARMEGQRGKNMVMHDFSFSPDGKLVLGVSSIFDGGVSIWQASTGFRLFRLFRLEQYIDDFRKARFSPCGRYIAAAAMDLKVRLWRTSDGSFLWRSSDESRASSFKHTDTVHVAFSPDGRTLCSARTMDGTVVIR
ncbi:hypothetical protein V8D89_015974 [Ganoderma adspersum]